MIRSLSLMALVWLARVLVPAAPAFAEEYWAATYEDARAGFRAAAGRVAAGWTGAEQKTFAVPSAHGEDLTVDSLYLPAQGEKRQLVVLVSGVHGMEGFAGSAIQRMFLAELAGKVDRQATGYLLVHSMNPYGMKHGRRATEANVNLNRNFSTKPELYQTANAEYGVLARVLQPEGAVRGITKNYMALALEVGKKLITGAFTMNGLNNAIGAGQYAAPAGLEFGGHAAEPQVRDLLARLAALAPQYTDLVLLDLHTGLGEAHQLHLMPGDADGVMDPDLFRRAFDREADADLYSFTPNDTPGFYRTHGDLNNVLAEIRRPGQRVIGLTMEFGTLGDSALAKLSSLNRLVLENQGYQHGYATSALEQDVKKLFAEMFFPSEAAWRRNVVARARGVLSRVAERLGR